MMQRILWVLVFCGLALKRLVSAQNDFDLRLVDFTGGTGGRYGRVEVYQASTSSWYAIEESGTRPQEMFDLEEALVVCRKLGYSYAAPLCCNILGEPYFSTATDAGYFDGVQCNGDEATIANCGGNIVAGQLPADAGFGRISAASVICSNDDDPSFSEMEYRLVSLTGEDTTAQGWGQTQMRYMSVWGHICANNLFSDREASVVCREIGYNRGRAYALGPKQSIGPIWLEYLACAGAEEHVAQCEIIYFGASDSDCVVGSGVICYDDELDIHLESSRPRGRLQVRYDGEEGRVCNQNFDIRDASLACQNLGYRDGESVPEGVAPAEGRVMMSDVYCRQPDQNLFQCESQWNQNNDCQADVSLQCYNYVRLVWVDDISQGVVKVFSESLDKWVLVCAENFDNDLAGRVCRELGYDRGMVNVSSYQRQSHDGNETMNLDCSDQPPDSPLHGCFEATDCQMEEFAAVHCFDDQEPDEEHVQYCIYNRDIFITAALIVVVWVVTTVPVVVRLVKLLRENRRRGKALRGDVESHPKKHKKPCHGKAKKDSGKKMTKARYEERK